jgi:hypothetical protein
MVSTDEKVFSVYMISTAARAGPKRLAFLSRTRRHSLSDQNLIRRLWQETRSAKMCVYLINLPLTIFHFLRAYRASVAHCVIVFISSYWVRVDRILSPLTREEHLLLVATSENDTVYKSSELLGQP